MTRKLYIQFIYTMWKHTDFTNEVHWWFFVLLKSNVQKSKNVHINFVYQILKFYKDWITELLHLWKWTIRFQVNWLKLFLCNIFMCSLLSSNLNFHQMPAREFWANQFLRNCRNQVHVHRSEVNRKFRFRTFFCFFWVFDNTFLTVYSKLIF